MKSWRSKATIWNHNKGFTESYCIKLDVDRSHENTAMYRRIVPSVLEWMRWVTIKISIQWRLHNGISLSQWWRRQRRCAAMTTGINRAAWRHRRHLPAQRPQCYPPQRPLLLTAVMLGYLASAASHPHLPANFPSRLTHCSHVRSSPINHAGCARLWLLNSIFKDLLIAALREATTP